MNTTLAVVPPTTSPTTADTSSLTLVSREPWMDIVPGADWEEFYSLPYAAQDEVKDWAPVMLELERRVNGDGDALDRVASEIARRLDEPGFSRQNIKTKFNHLWPVHGWRGLYNQAKWGRLNREDIELHGDATRKLFLDFVAAYLEGNQRKSKAGYRSFIRHWYNGGEVPGYGTWKDYWHAKRGMVHLRSCPRTLPAGWSFENLYPKAKPTKVEFALARHGTSAALALLPSIPRTREGMRALELVSFDDVKHDDLHMARTRMLVPGYSVPCRMLMLGARDTAGAYWLRAGLRPELPQQVDETKKEALRASDMNMLQLVTLMDFGYPADYISYRLLEHGTATHSLAKCKAIYQLTRGHVVCTFSSMEGQMVLAWDERGHGNSRAKAGHESDHNLLHNERGEATGQVGMGRDDCPQHNDLMRREARDLAKLQRALPRHLAEQVRMPFASHEEAMSGIYDALDRMNNRTGHRLEAFRPIVEWRMKGEVDWRTEEELTRVLVAAGKTFEEFFNTGLIELNPHPRLETPAERFRRLYLAERFIKPSFAEIRFLLDDQIAGLKVRNGAISFTRDKISYNYWPQTMNDLLPDSEDLRREYLGWFIPMAMDYLMITDADGRFLGTWKRMKVEFGDTKAKADAIHRKKLLLNEGIGNVRRRDTLRPDSKMVQRHDDLDTNLRIMAEAGFLSHDQLREAGVEPHTISAPANPAPRPHGAASELDSEEDQARSLSSQRAPATPASAEADSLDATTTARRGDSAEPLAADAEVFSASRRDLSTAAELTAACNRVHAEIAAKPKRIASARAERMRMQDAMLGS